MSASQWSFPGKLREVTSKCSTGCQEQALVVRDKAERRVRYFPEQNAKENISRFYPQNWVGRKHLSMVRDANSDLPIKKKKSGGLGWGCSYGSHSKVHDAEAASEENWSFPTSDKQKQESKRQASKVVSLFVEWLLISWRKVFREQTYTKLLWKAIYTCELLWNREKWSLVPTGLMHSANTALL